MASISTFAAFSSRGYGFGGNNPIFPTGGDYVIEDVTRDKRIHVFVNSGNFIVPNNIKDTVGKFFNAEVLVVGGGGGAGSDGSGSFEGGAGGGGGGGAVVYDSSYKLVRNKTFSVTVGGSGPTNSPGGKSIFEGLPNAGAGGAGGNGNDYSMGGSYGGPGGGGSWVSGQPGGPDYSAASPGIRWGSTGPTAPAPYTFIATDLTPTFFTAGSGQPSLSPIPTPYISNITRRWKGDMYGYSRGGFGNYGAGSAPPDSTKGLASTGYYSSNGFRARGGGGAGYSGGFGGQGVLTDFIDKEDGTWKWILGGGSGWIPGGSGGYESLRGVTGAYIWRDSGVKSDGTYLANSFVTGVSVDRWSTDRTTLNDTHMSPSPRGSRQADGSGSIGGGSGWPDRATDGNDGTIVIRYDLTAFPGGAPSASANVFGGDITTSANGKYRYHTWTVGSPQGTSSNSMTWYIGDSYRPRDTRAGIGADGTFEPTQWAQVTTQFGGSSAANTNPFYYNGDVPSFNYDLLIVGGGGASGAGPGTSSEDAWMPGGGGSGGIYFHSAVASRSLPTVVKQLEGLNLQSDLRRYANSGSNIETNDSDFGRLITDGMDLRPGFIQVYPNSTLNDMMQPRQYAYASSGANPVNYYDPNTPTGNSRERSFRIKMRGDNVKKPGVVRRVYHNELGDSFFGTNSVGSGAFNSRKYYYIMFDSTDGGSPPCQDGGWGDSFTTHSYDRYFYENYTRVRLGRYSQEDEENYIAGVNGDGSGSGNENDKPFTLGTWTGVFDLAYGDTRFSASTATGTHPQTGESYYNCIRIDSALTRFENPKGTDPSQGNNFKSSGFYWSKFWSKVTGYGTSYKNIWDASTGGSQNSPNVWDHGYRTGYVSNLTTVDHNNNRTIRFRQSDSDYGFTNNSIGLTGAGDTSRQGKFVAIFQIIQVDQSTGLDIPSTRKFKEVNTDSNDVDFTIDAGWRIIDGSTNSSQMAWINTEGYFSGDREKQMRSYVQVYKKMLRRLVVTRYAVHDIQVGKGGWGDRSASPRARRNGATSSYHPANINDPGSDRRAYGGGAGGNLNQNRGVGRDDVALGATTMLGSAGGSAFVFDADETSDAYPANEGGSLVPSISRSEPTVAYHGGGAGGGSISSLNVNGLQFGGATRNEFFTRGKTSRQRTGYEALADGWHGGRGYFGAGSPVSTGNWYYFKNNSSNPGDGTTLNYSGSDYYYYVTVNQFPHNAAFGSGGGAGSLSSGSNGSGQNGGTGGNGGSGSTYSITGYSTVYAHGGGGAGRFINGTPGNSQPAEPASQTVPSGAPDSPAYLPYGGGGGISAGIQEGLGAIPQDGSSRLYHPGSGPWPAAYPVSIGTAHMDTLRWKHADCPAPQKGHPGTAYAGKQGVVIISYNRSQFL